MTNISWQGSQGQLLLEVASSPCGISTGKIIIIIEKLKNYAWNVPYSLKSTDLLLLLRVKTNKNWEKSHLHRSTLLITRLWVHYNCKEVLCKLFNQGLLAHCYPIIKINLVCLYFTSSLWKLVLHQWKSLCCHKPTAYSFTKQAAFVKNSIFLEVSQAGKWDKISKLYLNHYCFRTVFCQCVS